MRKHFPTGICCSLAASSPQRRSATGEKCRRSLMHLSSPAKADWHRDQSKGSNETWNMLNLLYLFMTLGRVMDGYECHFHYTAYWLPVSQTAPQNPSESKLPDSTWNTEQPARFFCFFFFCVSWPLAWNHTNFLNYSKLTAFCHFVIWLASFCCWCQQKTLVFVCYHFKFTVCKMLLLLVRLCT